MSAPFQTILLTLTVGLVYFWLQNPVLSQYTLQAFAVSALLYFIIKQRSQSKFWHLTPAHLSWEMAIATFVLLLLVAGTGNTASVFFPLSFVHLFFLVFATRPATSFIVTGLILLLHYSLEPNVAAADASLLLSLPLMLIFFLFAKSQYDQTIKDQILIQQEEKTANILESQEGELESFVTGFLKNKLFQIKELVNSPQENQKAIQGQLTLIEVELEKVLTDVKGSNQVDATDDNATSIGE